MLQLAGKNSALLLHVVSSTHLSGPGSLDENTALAGCGDRQNEANRNPCFGRREVEETEVSRINTQAGNPYMFGVI